MNGAGRKSGPIFQDRPSIVVIQGSDFQIAAAKIEIDMVLESFHARNNPNGRPSSGFQGTGANAGYGGGGGPPGAAGGGGGGFNAIPIGHQRIEYPIPGDKVGLVIGRGGETIKSIIARSGARVEVDKNNEPGVPTRICFITGEDAAIEAAKNLINEAIQPVQRDMRVRKR